MADNARDGRDPPCLIEATSSNARLANKSWRRPIEVDFLHHGVRLAFAEWPPSAAAGLPQSAT